MKKLIILFLILSSGALAWYFFFSSTSIPSLFSMSGSAASKCTIQSGKIYYGEVPNGVTCIKSEKVDTSITVLQSPKIVSGERSEAKKSNAQCDGRKFCSQMRSCDEAKFFLNNCPNTLLDGNLDGVPCQKQWCRRQ